MLQSLQHYHRSAKTQAPNFLEQIVRPRITILIAGSTVVIALLLTLFVLTGDDDQVKEKFDFGKKVLGVLGGILGTIVGFYFGSSSRSQAVIQAALTADATSGQIEAKGLVSGGKAPYTIVLSFDPQVFGPLVITSVTGGFDEKLPVTPGKSGPATCIASILDSASGPTIAKASFQISAPPAIPKNPAASSK